MPNTYYLIYPFLLEYLFNFLLILNILNNYDLRLKMKCKKVAYVAKKLHWHQNVDLIILFFNEAIII